MPKRIREKDASDPGSDRKVPRGPDDDAPTCTTATLSRNAALCCVGKLGFIPPEALAPRTRGELVTCLEVFAADQRLAPELDLTKMSDPLDLSHPNMRNVEVLRLGRSTGWVAEYTIPSLTHLAKLRRLSVYLPVRRPVVLLPPTLTTLRLGELPPTLKELAVTGAVFDLSRLRAPTSLEGLTLHEIEQRSSVARLPLDVMEPLPNLRKLSVVHCSLGPQDLATAWRSPSLREFRLEGPRHSAAWCRPDVFAHLNECKNLREIYLSDLPSGNTPITIASSSLEVLTVRKCGPGLVLSPALVALSTLTLDCVNDCKFTSDTLSLPALREFVAISLQQLVAIDRCPKLFRASMTNCNSLREVRGLHCSMARLKVVGCGEFETVEDCRGMIRLCVERCPKFARVCGCPGLRLLQVWNCPRFALEDSRGTEEVDHVHLDGIRLGQDSFQALPNIRWLACSNPLKIWRGAVNRLPMLETLTTSHYGAVRYTLLEDILDGTIMPNLKQLECDSVELKGREGWSDLFPGLQSLTIHVDFWSGGRTLASDLADILASVPRLQSFAVSTIASSRGFDVDAFIAALPVGLLHVTVPDTLDDRRAAALVVRCPGLQSITAVRTPLLPGYAYASATGLGEGRQRLVRQ